MPVPGNPVAPLVVGQTFTVQAPITPSTGQQWVVELDNVSPYPLTIGGSIASSVLPPMQSNTYTAHSGPAGVTVTVNAPFDNSTPPAGIPAYLTSTWAILPDTIQGVFPMAIPATTLVSGQQQAAAGPFSLLPPNGQIVTVPPWAQSGIVQLTSGAAIFAVRGQTTTGWYSQFQALSQNLIGALTAFSFPVAPEIDSVVEIGLYPGTSGPADFVVYFTSGPPITFPLPPARTFTTTFSNPAVGLHTLLSGAGGACYLLEGVSLELSVGGTITASSGCNATVQAANAWSQSPTLTNVHEVAGPFAVAGIVAPTLIDLQGILTYPGTDVDLNVTYSTGDTGAVPTVVYRQMM